MAVEPSEVMIAQRPEGAAPCVQASAESLPFEDDSFDAAMAIITDHHWRDQAAGFGELRRVARRVVLLTWDERTLDLFWLAREYLPEFRDLPSGLRFSAKVAALAPARVEPVPVPHGCVDGFFSAHWARPEAYLDPAVREVVSVFQRLPVAVVDAAMARLADDLASGEWDRRHGALRGLGEFDAGFRLIVRDAA